MKKTRHDIKTAVKEAFSKLSAKQKTRIVEDAIEQEVINNWVGYEKCQAAVLKSGGVVFFLSDIEATVKIFDPDSEKLTTSRVNETECVAEIKKLKRQLVSDDPNVNRDSLWRVAQAFKTALLEIQGLKIEKGVELDTPRLTNFHPQGYIR